MNFIPNESAEKLWLSEAKLYGFWKDFHHEHHLFSKSAQDHSHHVLIISFQIRNVRFATQIHMSIGMQIIWYDPARKMISFLSILPILSSNSEHKWWYSSKKWRSGLQYSLSILYWISFRSASTSRFTYQMVFPSLST